MTQNLNQYQDPTDLKKLTIRWYIASLCTNLIGGFIVFVIFIIAFFNLIFSGILTSSGELEELAGATSAVAGFGVFLIITIIVLLVIFVVTVIQVIYYAMWAYRVNQNAQILAPGKVRINPSLQVAGIILPLILGIVAFIPILVFSTLTIAGISLTVLVSMVLFAISLLNLLALKQIAKVNLKEKGSNSANMYFYLAIANITINLLSTVLSAVLYLEVTSEITLVVSLLRFGLGSVSLVVSIITIIYFIRMINQISDGQIDTFKESSSAL